jgi:hypothetical protein
MYVCISQPLQHYLKDAGSQSCHYLALFGAVTSFLMTVPPSILKKECGCSQSSLQTAVQMKNSSYSFLNKQKNHEGLK